MNFDTKLNKIQYERNAREKPHDTEIIRYLLLRNIVKTIHYSIVSKNMAETTKIAT